jgi:dinuclear metal center YbgI/SA1388 family protein
MGTAVRPTVADIARVIAERYPVERAEPWDRVGLLVGDPSAPVQGVALSLDPSVAAIDAAVAAGANVLVTHHPAFLTAPERILAGPGARGVAFHAARMGVALVCAHTNLDRDPVAQETLPAALGLVSVGPLERSEMPMAMVTAFVPPLSAEAVISAMRAAGAGRIGQYAGCSFSAPGEGRFTPGSQTHPAIGSPGEPSSAEEVRVEMVCAPGDVSRVMEAACASNPYEEPLVTASQVTISRDDYRLGRVSELSPPMTLQELAARAAAAFEVTPRVWGDPSRPVRRLGTTTGSGGSLIGDAVATCCDAFLAGEVRYHDATEAVASGLGVIEIGHDVSEWPLVPVLRDAVLAVSGLDADAVHVLPRPAGSWVPEKRDEL